MLRDWQNLLQVAYMCPRHYSPGMRTIPLCLLSLQCRMQAHRDKPKHQELQLEIFGRGYICTNASAADIRMDY